MKFISDETMSSYQLADYTGKKPSEVIWDIHAMLDELPHAELEGGITFVNINSKRAEVKLSKLMTYRLIMRYTRVQQDVIRCAWGDLEIPVAQSLQDKSVIGGKRVPRPRQRRAQRGRPTSEIYALKCTALGAAPSR